jgi:hypothetical protein
MKKINKLKTILILVGMVSVIVLAIVIGSIVCAILSIN